MNRFACLMYHALGSRLAGHYVLMWDDFERQIDWLRGREFTISGFPDMEERIREGRIPSRFIVTSFDDGHKSNLRAAEILRKHGAQGTFFLTKELCRSRADFLNPQEIKELSCLCSVGAHGATHRPLSYLPSGALEQELTDSKAWLEDIIGRSVDFMSAPGGFVNRRVERAAAEAGYLFLGNSREWWNAPATMDGVVRRVAVRSGFDIGTLERVAFTRLSYFGPRQIREAAMAGPRLVRARLRLRRLDRGGAR